VVGPVGWFEVEELVAEPERTPVSQIAAEPVEVLDQQLRIVAFAGRLAELSSRLDYARPPPRWGDLSDVPRERAWRARMSALHEMPMAAGGFR
jgi:hypothetical protein